MEVGQLLFECLLYAGNWARLCLLTLQDDLSFLTYPSWWTTYWFVEKPLLGFSRNFNITVFGMASPTRVLYPTFWDTILTLAQHHFLGRGWWSHLFFYLRVVWQSRRRSGMLSELTPWECWLDVPSLGVEFKQIFSSSLVLTLEIGLSFLRTNPPDHGGTVIPGVLRFICIYIFSHLRDNKKATAIRWGYRKCSVLKVVLRFGKEETAAELPYISRGLAPLSSTISFRASQTLHSLFLGQISGCQRPEFRGRRWELFGRWRYSASWWYWLLHGPVVCI